ncbi:MAG: AmmeMemoRadiSam system protein B, partial [Planctomycetes bacterium]|nr:AmmeMemoRadiSam system protein B [Planctomycetota bacterium]
YELTGSHLQPVLDTLRWLKHETDVWFEITNLVIPDANDSPDELRRLCDWILENLGDDVPVHFTAFHPDFRMRDRPPTPHSTLVAARQIALDAGIRYAYVGNVYDVERESTYCGSCGKLVIERNRYVLGTYALNGNRCRWCGEVIPGRFEDRPGDWGSKRMPVDMRQFARKREHDKREQDWEVTAEALRQATEMLKSQSQPPQSSPSGSGNPKSSSSGGTATMSNDAPTQVELSEEQKQVVLRAAAEYVRAAACKERPNPPDLEAAGVARVPVSGTFVSLKRRGQLRSCCGNFGRSMPLQEALQEAAHRTATSDPRFPPISPSELPYLDMEVWLLFAPELIRERGEDRVQAVTVGRHGLQIIRGANRGLLLPGVPVDHGWDSRQFLEQVCVKAGLPTSAWREDDTILYRFQGEVIRGRVEAPPEATATRRLLSDGELQRYTQYCRDNIAAMLRGATPLYYCEGVSDANVNGVIVMASMPEARQDLNVWRLAIKNCMPLQSTLFSLCEDMANAVRRRGWMSGRYRLDIAIAYDPTMHGTVASPDLEGIDTSRRALVVFDRSRSGVAFDASSRPEDVLTIAAEAAQVSDPEFAPVYSLAIQSTRPQFTLSSAPRPTGGASVRPPAVAGAFYPGTAAEIDRMLDQMLEPDVTPRPCHAVMVPHAGWRYSGRLAAQTLQRVQFPSTVIAFGPKHTAPGVDWAIAPHHRWSLPGREVDSDFELARRIAEAVPELQLDAAAHQQEHSLEVQLPIIARLAPQTRVIGIVIGGGSLDRCDQCAEHLAELLRGLDEKPLLLISTDMSHYVSESEARRLDALALAELDRLDPDALFQTVRKHRISMCGVLPAVIVLKTLQKLDLLHECEPVGYTTSAEASGDTSRVVGYAGRIFR